MNCKLQSSKKLGFENLKVKHLNFTCCKVLFVQLRISSTHNVVAVTAVLPQGFQTPVTAPKWQFKPLQISEKLIKR